MVKTLVFGIVAGIAGGIAAGVWIDRYDKKHYPWIRMFI